MTIWLWKGFSTLDTACCGGEERCSAQVCGRISNETEEGDARCGSCVIAMCGHHPNVNHIRTPVNVELTGVPVPLQA